MTRPLAISVTCSRCGLLGEGRSSDPAQSRRPPNWKGVDGNWGRWDELDRLADRHPHPTRALASPTRRSDTP